MKDLKYIIIFLLIVTSITLSHHYVSVCKSLKTKKLYIEELENQVNGNCHKIFTEEDMNNFLDIQSDEYREVMSKLQKRIINLEVQKRLKEDFKEEDKPLSLSEERIEKQRKYVERFARIAILEQEKCGVPASITLAQGILESQSGESKLAISYNNHFGIKCGKSNCNHGKNKVFYASNCKSHLTKEERGKGLEDEVALFRVFESPWKSYRQHSLLLATTKRYRHLTQYKDYKKWAYGLKKAGYATDSHYPDKLINLIEKLDLYQFDKK